MKKQQGFTLIELIVVIVILGILAATAMPKFIDLRADATQSAVSAVGGGFTSASAMNAAGCAMTGAPSVASTKCVPVNKATKKCSDIAMVTDGSVTVTAGAAPGTTNPNTYYVLADTTLAAGGTDGTTCNLILGDGGAGKTAPYTFYATY